MGDLTQLTAELSALLASKIDPDTAALIEVPAEARHRVAVVLLLLRAIEFTTFMRATAALRYDALCI